MYKKIVAFLCALSLLLPIGIHASDDLYLGGDSIGIQLDYNG
ncbi:MAG TPA: stage IV sporulation protein B, partial [Erysipelotrichaceae bacterium]|nr:stage IV sporulation protein B [Erysipelotrichaceae bacterium]